jgi:hypothetical protein
VAGAGGQGPRMGGPGFGFRGPGEAGGQGPGAEGPRVGVCETKPISGLAVGTWPGMWPNGAEMPDGWWAGGWGRANGIFETKPICRSGVGARAEGVAAA